MACMFCITGDYPGPGAYDPKFEFVTTSVPAYTIPRASPWVYDLYVAPGPGTYNVKHTIPGPGYSMMGKKECKRIHRQVPRPSASVPAKASKIPAGSARVSETTGLPRKLGQGIITMHYK